MRDFFRWGTKKNTILRTAIKVILVYYVVMLLFTFAYALEGDIYADYPCFTYVLDNGCLEEESLNAVTSWHEPVEGKDIEVFLTTYAVKMSGGGCLYGASNTSEVSVEDQYDNKHSFKKDGTNLVIDDRVVVLKNGTWAETKALILWDPWLVLKYKLSVKNYGVVNCTAGYWGGNVSEYGPALVVIGSVGSYDEANYGGIAIFLILIGLLIYFYHKRDVEAPTQGHEEGG